METTATQPADPPAEPARFPTPVAVSQIRKFTGDLDRCAAFYTELIGLRLTVMLRQPFPPHHRHALFQVGDSPAVVHVMERPGPSEANGGETSQPRRGRLDSLGFLVADRSDLDAVAARLAAAGASDGRVREAGPFLTLRFRDPDGLEGEVNAPNRGFDPTLGGGCTMETAGDERWLDVLHTAGDATVPPGEPSGGSAAVHGLVNG
jgi:catechol 2,3-dioxygenase-like lactoylglutathione lyase family enzyme